MLKKYFSIISIIFLVLYSCSRLNETVTVKNTTLTDYVNPLIGTGGHGHTYPGATVPFGMIQLSPDNGTSGWEWCSGYHYSDSITIGFSHLHLSGTGIGDLYDIRLMPINKKVDLTTPIKSRDDIPYKSSYTHTQEVSKAGYYSIDLINHNIKAELTTDLRTGFHKYTYAENDTQSVIIDLGFAINWDRLTESGLKIEDKFTISGYRHSTGWAKNQKVFFVAKFSKSLKEYDLIVDSKYVEKTKSVKGTKTAVQLFFNDVNNESLEVKVGLSSVSIENALENMSDHMERFEFDRIKNEAEKKWEQNLSKILIETPNDSLKEIFYSALYHTQIAPVTFSDKNGAFRQSNDSIYKTDKFVTYSSLSLWDTFRAEQPLLTILDPNRVSDIVNSMLVYYNQNKTLPVWNLYGNETNTMTGYHSIPVIAEASLKGITGFDIEKAYSAMKTTMMQDARGLSIYKEYGYIPYNLLDESVTITLEYAYNDWCVAQIAKLLNKQEDYKYFLNRSKAYKYLFDPETGFMRGKNDTGTGWHEPFDPKFSAHRVHADYTEGNAWQHSWFVLHDTNELIKLHGGNNKFSNKLEQLFTESSEITGENVSADISGLIGQYAHGNEPSHHIAYMFNFANQPWRTQYWVREILKSQYFATPDGLSGNEDCGQMSAWYVFSSMGLYPYNPSSGLYQIGSPLFEKSVIKISENTNFTIIAENVSDKNKYIQSATLNNVNFNRTVLMHQELKNGGTLHFVMGDAPNKNWGVH
ncbi:GH92 family glycosyl hydrolase [Urechidicola vernalis]|uniref:GH92 family glycosyl hydrolase n=1 Tax=Urechidicola vernalis TaxID=3075600 RepID=A0ABU2Y4W3_9FLAO|nr:GH92 family glycosyl hydrolase [Urechidicola sp. P050]MDT0553234.1 GH92 family glycosyl hydrolase [Urechidicola sp. P050]